MSDFPGTVTFAGVFPGELAPTGQALGTLALEPKDRPQPAPPPLPDEPVVDEPPA